MITIIVYKFTSIRLLFFSFNKHISVLFHLILLLVVLRPQKEALSERYHEILLTNRTWAILIKTCTVDMRVCQTITTLGISLQNKQIFVFLEAVLTPQKELWSDTQHEIVPESRPFDQSIFKVHVRCLLEPLTYKWAKSFSFEKDISLYFHFKAYSAFNASKRDLK